MVYRRSDGLKKAEWYVVVVIVGGRGEGKTIRDSMQGYGFTRRRVRSWHEKWLWNIATKEGGKKKKRGNVLSSVQEVQLPDLMQGGGGYKTKTIDEMKEKKEVSLNDGAYMTIKPKIRAENSS